MRKDMNVALICDDAYVMPTAVTIKSIASNILLNGNTLNIYVCTMGIQSDNKNMLEGLSEKGVVVHVVDFSDSGFLKKLEGVTEKSHVSKTSLIKFELPNIFLDIDTLLYMDSDIIVKGNISDIFDVVIDDCYVAASFELWKYFQNIYTDNKADGDIDFYFNSGVMLMNLKMMRENDVSLKLWEAKKQLLLDKTKTTMDQDSLNVVFKDKAKPLSIRWNFNVAFSKKTDIHIINRVYKENYTDISSALNDAVVLHYVGKEDKPWNYSSALCCEQWDKYYLSCGFDSKVLGERKVVKHGLKWYGKILKNVYKKNGLKGVFLLVKSKSGKGAR